jgi:hypothetical protein
MAEGCALSLFIAELAGLRHDFFHAAYCNAAAFPVYFDKTDALQRRVNLSAR